MDTSSTREGPLVTAPREQLVGGTTGGVYPVRPRPISRRGLVASSMQALPGCLSGTHRASTAQPMGRESGLFLRDHRCCRVPCESCRSRHGRATVFASVIPEIRMKGASAPGGTRLRPPHLSCRFQESSAHARSSDHRARGAGSWAGGSIGGTADLVTASGFRHPDDKQAAFKRPHLGRRRTRRPQRLTGTPTAPAVRRPRQAGG